MSGYKASPHYADVEVIARRAKKHGFTDGQKAVYRALCEVPKPTPLDDIARQANVSRQFARIVIHIFEDYGFVRLFRDKYGRLRHGHGVVSLVEDVDALEGEVIGHGE